MKLVIFIELKFMIRFMSISAQDTKCDSELFSPVARITVFFHQLSTSVTEGIFSVSYTGWKLLESKVRKPKIKEEFCLLMMKNST